MISVKLTYHDKDKCQKVGDVNALVTTGAAAVVAGVVIGGKSKKQKEPVENLDPLEGKNNEKRLVGLVTGKGTSQDPMSSVLLG